MLSGILRLLPVALAPVLLTAGDRNHSWDVLAQSAKTGNKVVVVRMGGGQVEGKLLSVDDDSITVEKKGQPHAIPRNEVYRVRYADIRMRNTLLGMVIGAAAGAAILGAATDTRKGLAAKVGAVSGLGFGALGGAVIPRGAPLYEAARPRRQAGAAAP